MGKYLPCPDSFVSDHTQSVGGYGKPDWVGADFKSIHCSVFSMTVMWEHNGAERLCIPNRSNVTGYEIRIYDGRDGHEEVLECLCVTDPNNMRNVSNIHSALFNYRATPQHMIVEVRTFPSLVGEDADNRRRNCSVLPECATRSTMEQCQDDCYSWPQSCLNFLPSYSPENCTTPFYSPPVNVTVEMTLVVDGNVTDSDVRQLDISWEPPNMNYGLFPVPNTYYVTIESDYDTFNLKIVDTTNITVLPLNFTLTYNVSVRAYVPCSGLSQIDITHMLDVDIPLILKY